MEYRDAPVLSFRPLDAKESKQENVIRLERLYTLICVACVTLAATFMLLSFVIRPIKVKDGTASYPAGSVVFVTPSWGEAKRGDAVAVCNGKADGSVSVRRVVAVGGDTVEIRNGTLFVNGRTPTDPAVSGVGNYPDLAETTVPAGRFYLLGDDPNGGDATGVFDARAVLGVVRFSVGR